MSQTDLSDAERLLLSVLQNYATKKGTSGFSSLIPGFASESGAPPPYTPDDPFGGFLARRLRQHTQTGENLGSVYAGNSYDDLFEGTSGELTDDRKYQLEKVVALAASLPSDSATSVKVTEALLKSLWNGLNRAPRIDMHAEGRYFGSLVVGLSDYLPPWLGSAAASHTRRMIPSKRSSPQLPDAGLVFDELFARSAGFRKHPTKLSTMFFHFTTIMLHDVCQTVVAKDNGEEISPRLNLSPLYGNSYDEQAQIRDLEGAVGRLKRDTIFDVRILTYPPAVGAILVCFNRFHNYIAEELLQINEGGRFTLHTHLGKEAAQAKRDEDIFHTARVITCGLYKNIISHDYIRTMLNLNRTNSDWNLDPRNFLNANPVDHVTQYNKLDVGIEFSLLHRWHSVISRRDEQWTIDLLREMHHGADPANISKKELEMAVVKFLDDRYSLVSEQWAFGGLQRLKDGSFLSDDLVRTISDATEDIAGAFGPRNTPLCLRSIEMTAIEDARKLSVATLNEYRQYFGLIPYKTFNDITTDPEIASALESLYDTPDQVELYVGFVVEDTKQPMIPGSGLCSGYTVSRTILANVLALLRDDEANSTEQSAATMTNWGYNQISSDPRAAGGGVMYKLLMQALPQYYKYNSVYAMFPFQIAIESHAILRHLQQQHIYDFSRPRFDPKPKHIVTRHAVQTILDDPHNFPASGSFHATVFSPKNYLRWGYGARKRADLEQSLYIPPQGMEAVFGLYGCVTETCLHEKSRKLRSGYLVDVVDVINVSSATVGAELFNIPLKTKNHQMAPFTPKEFHALLSLLSDFTALGFDRSITQQYLSGVASRTLLPIIGSVVQNSLGSSFLSYSFASLTSLFNLEKSLQHSYGVKLIERLSKECRSSDEVAQLILPSLTAMVTVQAHNFAHILDLLLDPRHYVKHWPLIEQLARSEDPYDFEKLKKYALEGMRLATASYGVLRNVDCENVRIKDGSNTVGLHKGDQVFVNFVTAGVDPTIFPDPYEIRLDRDEQLYLNFGWGAHQCPGKTIAAYALAAQLKAFGKLKNLRRAPGEQGHMKYKVVDGTFRHYMSADWSSYSPFPTSMKVMFDHFTPDDEDLRAASEPEDFFSARNDYPYSTAETTSPAIGTFENVHDGPETQIESRSTASEESSSLEMVIAAGNHDELMTIMMTNFEQVAQGEYLWLKEIVEIGYSISDIATLLIDENTNTPWIYFEPVTDLQRGVSIEPSHHLPQCVHHVHRQLRPNQKNDDVRNADFNLSDPSSPTENASYRQKIMEFCGLAGLKPVSNQTGLIGGWVKQTSFTGSDCTEATITYRVESLENDDVVYLAFNHIVQDLRSIFAWMQDQDLCCNSFTVLIKHEGKPMVEIQSIDVMLIERFANSLHSLLLTAVPSPLPEGLIGVLQEILKNFCVDLTTEIDSLLGDPAFTLQVCALSVQLICLGLASYSYAHVGPLQPFFLDCSLRKVNLLGINDNGTQPIVVFELCRLTCLGDMLNSEVFVFRSPREDATLSKKCDLLASPEDLVDTWGPGTLISGSLDNRSSELCAIEIGGGTVFLSSESDKFHWVQGRVQHASVLKTFNASEKVVIGAVKINTSCPLDEVKSIALCQDFLVPLGASADSWEEAQRSITLQGGQYLNAQIGYAWNKKPGVTVKDLIMSSFSEGRARKSDLQARWGLQVSLCTGITRRVTLLEMLADVTRSYVENCIPVQITWKKLINDRALSDKFRDPSFWKWYEDELDADEKISVVQIIAYVLHALKTTGLDLVTDELVVAWALKQDPFSCIRVRCDKNNFWARILVDSELCATFAYMTTACMETSTHSCRQREEVAWMNDTASLDTAVSRHRASGAPGQQNDWTLTVKTAYWIGKPGTDLLAKVSRSVNSSELRLSVQHSIIPEAMRKRMEMFKRKQLERIREPANIDARAKQVMICSE